jgi:hypothetical protein
MTNPITPPPELVQQLRNSAPRGIRDAFGSLTREIWLINHAYAAGAEKAQALADQELEACCEWLRQSNSDWEIPRSLRAARRPKPPSLKRVALLQLDTLNADLGLEGKGVDLSQIRRALEAAND